MPSSSEPEDKPELQLIKDSSDIEEEEVKGKRTQLKPTVVGAVKVFVGSEDEDYILWTNEKKKGKLKPLRAQERAEITEYSHLLRTLRIEYASDITYHLVNAAAESKANPNPERRRGRPPATLRSGAIWPIHSQDLPKPQFDLADEVRLIAEHHIRRQSKPDPPEDDALPPALPDDVVEHLTLRTRTLLEHALDLLSATRPTATAKQQRALIPMNWEILLRALAATGAVDETVLERAHKRLEALCGTSSKLPAHKGMQYVYVPKKEEKGILDQDHPMKDEEERVEVSYEEHLDDDLKFLAGAKELALKQQAASKEKFAKLKAIAAAKRASNLTPAGAVSPKPSTPGSEIEDKMGDDPPEQESTSEDISDVPSSEPEEDIDDEPEPPKEGRQSQRTHAAVSYAYPEAAEEDSTDEYEESD